MDGEKGKVEIAIPVFGYKRAGPGNSDSGRI